VSGGNGRWVVISGGGSRGGLPYHRLFNVHVSKRLAKLRSY
jgi:hypothetical protein